VAGSREDLAKTSAPPEKEPESAGHEAGSGVKWRESLAKYDLSTSSWKIPQCLFAGDLSEYSGTWPRWGTMRNGELWERNMPLQIRSLDASITNEKESGLLGRFPTPTVCGNYNRKGASKTSGDGLATVVQRFPTPDANMGRRGSQSEWKSKRASGQHAQYTLNQAVRDAGGGMATVADMEQAKFSGNSGNRPEYATVNATPGGSLNPDWVELLMGWPRGWSSLEPLPSAEFRGWGDGWEDGTPRVGKNIPASKGRLKAIGNGQVPQCAALAWRVLTGRGGGL
jgi:hypothetical protein